MKTMEVMLEQARTTLNKAINDPQVLAILSQRGYGAEQLQEGLMLCEAALDAAKVQGAARFGKVNTTQLFQQQWKLIKLQYNHDVRVARLALKEYNGSHYFLQLNGTQTKAFDTWFAQAKDFYFGLRNQTELQSAVGEVGLTVERIEQGIQSLQKLETLHEQQQMQKESSQRTRQQRDEAAQTFDRWMTTFRQYARLALASTPGALPSLWQQSTSRRATREHEEGTATIPAQSDMPMIPIGVQ